MNRRMIILPGEEIRCGNGHTHSTPKEAENCERRAKDRSAGRQSLAAFRFAQSLAEEQEERQ